MKEGDIFRWSYKTPDPYWSNVSYWAKSRIGIVKNGALVDTYWGVSGGNATWSVDEARELLALEFVANMGELIKVPEWQEAYYAASDFVNLNHANSPSGNAYIRKGAQRSREKMLETVANRVSRVESRIVSLQAAHKSLCETGAQLEAGEALDGLHIADPLP